VTRLRVTERRLADLLESKDRFLASVAHELRTPLTAVVGFANELQIDDALTPAERREFVDLIAFHGTEMAHIIEDLLVWARGDIGEVRVSPQTIDLNTTVHQTLRLLPGVDFPVREPDGTVEAVADPARMRQIVRNLATNAVRYGGDAVEVVVRRQNGSAVVEVSDNGPRLAPEDMGRIFEPYGRADGSVIGPGSIGLGLTVSRTLARLQGGDLVFLRDGSRNVFRVTVPV
jgi:signal transduction histidine kinase